jgi:hypothetical protein
MEKSNLVIPSVTPDKLEKMQKLKKTLEEMNLYIQDTKIRDAEGHTVFDMRD